MSAVGEVALCALVGVLECLAQHQLSLEGTEHPAQHQEQEGEGSSPSRAQRKGPLGLIRSPAWCSALGRATSAGSARQWGS